MIKKVFILLLLAALFAPISLAYANPLGDDLDDIVDSVIGAKTQDIRWYKIFVYNYDDKGDETIAKVTLYNAANPNVPVKKKNGDPLAKIGAVLKFTVPQNSKNEKTYFFRGEKKNFVNVKTENITPHKILKVIPVTIVYNPLLTPAGKKINLPSTPVGKPINPPSTPVGKPLKQD